MNVRLVLFFAGLLCMGGLSAEEKPRLWPRGPEVADLKAAGLSDDEIAKAREAVTGVRKKDEEMNAKPEVKAQADEVKKLEADLRAAEKKLAVAKGGFTLLDEQKKAVYESVPADKREKIAEVLKYKPKKEK